MGVLPKEALIHITEVYILMESRFLASEDLRTIIGAETSIASTVTSSICLTQLSTLTSSKSILEAPMAK
jgi:hypothetical protein